MDDKEPFSPLSIDPEPCLYSSGGQGGTHRSHCNGQGGNLGRSGDESEPDADPRPIPEPEAEFEGREAERAHFTPRNAAQDCHEFDGMFLCRR